MSSVRSIKEASLSKPTEDDDAKLSHGNYNRLEIGAGLLVCIGILYLLCVAIGAATQNMPGIGGYVLHASFVSASGLNVGDPVAIAGVKVGTVESISLDDYQARVALRIKNAVEVHGDASAAIEREGLVGDRSVSIDPGTAGKKPLGPGDEIEDTESPLGITELLGKWLTGDLTSDEWKKPQSVAQRLDR